MEKTVFAADFWKDYLWLFSLPAVLGLFIFIAGIISLWYAFANSEWIMIFAALILIFIGQALMYTLECGLMQRVAIDKNRVSFRYPKLYWPFSFNEETAELKEINNIALGYFLMAKIFPNEPQSVSQSLRYAGNIGFEIGYNKKNKNIIKKMGPPIIHSWEYYEAIKGLIKNANLKPSELGFVFKKKI